MEQLERQIREKQIDFLNGEAAIGKTIAFVNYVYINGPGRFIGFTDGSFAIVEACHYYDSTAFEDVPFRIGDCELAEGAIKLGLLDKKVYDDYNKAIREAGEKQREVYRRQQYESLRAEFGDL